MSYPEPSLSEHIPQAERPPSPLESLFTQNQDVVARLHKLNSNLADLADKFRGAEPKGTSDEMVNPTSVGGLLGEFQGQSNEILALVGLIEYQLRRIEELI